MARCLDLVRKRLQWQATSGRVPNERTLLRAMGRVRASVAGVVPPGEAQGIYDALLAEVGDQAQVKGGVFVGRPSQRGFADASGMAR